LRAAAAVTGWRSRRIDETGSASAITFRMIRLPQLATRR
jgi:hypothetical protein